MLKKIKNILTEVSCWIYAIIATIGIVQVYYAIIATGLIGGELIIPISTVTYLGIGLVAAIGGYVLLYKTIMKKES
jgi:hypothetical protein